MSSTWSLQYSEIAPHSFGHRILHNNDVPSQITSIYEVTSPVLFSCFPCLNHSTPFMVYVKHHLLNIIAKLANYFDLTNYQESRYTKIIFNIYMTLEHAFECFKISIRDYTFSGHKNRKCQILVESY